MILFVSERDVCRSVLAASILRAANPLPSVEIRHAGMTAVVGVPADPLTVSIGRRLLGVDLADHVASQVTNDEIASAGLILTATRAIRSQIVRAYAPAIRRSFTIRQVGRILSSSTHTFNPGASDATETLSAFVRFLNQERSPLGLGRSYNDDIIDPHGQRAQVHEFAAREIVSSVGLLSGAFKADSVAWVPAS
ncbi:hypothetical protein [Micropruina sp.]|uniref:arsenate reductase/protein-tyrosine-phosphatase family protein n=1 Tax=Micropruina sp. TaxID=2737536 RepID=UPI0039E679C0